MYKKGNKDLAVNYHPIPISLTSVCFKVIEHVIYHSIMIEIMYFLAINMAYSCSTQIISLIGDLNFHMDHNVEVDMILLDFLKAFNIVPHCHLLKKLKFYHIEN